MKKIRRPLRWSDTNRSMEMNPTEQYTPEFDDCQAERIFNRDLSIIVVAVIAILALCILGVI